MSVPGGSARQLPDLSDDVALEAANRVAYAFTALAVLRSLCAIVGAIGLAKPNQLVGTPPLRAAGRPGAAEQLRQARTVDRPLRAPSVSRSAAIAEAGQDLNSPVPPVSAGVTRLAMLPTIRNLARLPQLAVDASVAVVDVAQRVAALQLIVGDRLAALDRAVGEVLVVLPAVADDLRCVRATVVPVEERLAAVLASVARLAGDVERLRTVAEPQLERVSAVEEIAARLELRVGELQHTLARVQGDVEDATEHLPDPDAPGPIARARDALTGRD